MKLIESFCWPKNKQSKPCSKLILIFQKWLKRVWFWFLVKHSVQNAFSPQWFHNFMPIIKNLNFILNDSLKRARIKPVTNRNVIYSKFWIWPISQSGKLSFLRILKLMILLFHQKKLLKIFISSSLKLRGLWATTLSSSTNKRLRILFLCVNFKKKKKS